MIYGSEVLPRIHEPIRRPAWKSHYDDPHKLITREWLVTNGRGGYASGTVAGVATRRYHGTLVAALPTPFGRTVMLNHLWEEVRLPSGEHARLGAHERADALQMHGVAWLTDFYLEQGLPVWRYEIDGYLLEKRVMMPHMQNTVFVRFCLLKGDSPLHIRLRPSMHFRSYEDAVSMPLTQPYGIRIIGDRYEFTREGFPTLRLRTFGRETAVVIDTTTESEIVYRVESERGYEAIGTLWTPGYFRADIAPRDHVTLVASTEDWEIVDALDPETALEAEYERRHRLLHLAPEPFRSGFPAELILAGDQFLISPSGRVEDAARAHAAGEELRSVIAGYHWFTDWGRDTMISLEGLAMVTGRLREAGYVLRTFAHYVRDGLIPNMFPDQSTEGLYHTADATLWFFHAIDRYFAYTGDEAGIELLLPVLRDIIDHHVRGTRFGIGVDQNDGLLRQGAPGYQLTWMDAKVDGWVVTPRRGKAVEINALWYNALCVSERFARMLNQDRYADRYAELAARARASFNERFWYEERGYLYDVVDGENGDDPACRPNQVFAVSLPNPVLDRSRWPAVVETARTKLLTPVGLRSLSPDHPDYKPKYYGDLRTRDAAYHQGTVWAWLIGPFVDAWLKVYPDARDTARDMLKGFDDHLNEFGVGSIAEIFDAEPPYTPRGCIAQAWSVAEVLRAYIKTCE